MSIIMLPSGTLEIQPTTPGRFIVIVNGRDRYSDHDFISELVKGYYRRAEWHPRGLDGFLGEFGIRIDDSCALCESGEKALRCGHCSIGRCAKCARSHDLSAICAETRRYADTHRVMRGADDFDESDWFFGRVSMSSTYIERSRH